MRNKIQKASRVKRSDAASYDAAAAEFALLTNRYSEKIAARMLDLGKVTSGERVLDLGTGTGLLARMAARRGAFVVGIDHSAGMLTQAQASADADGVGDRTEFLAMDAEALSFEPEAFDITVSLFVLRHLPDPVAAAREMHRTLKPGGRLIAAIGARPNPFQPAGFAAAIGSAWDRLQAGLGRRVLSPDSLRDFLRREGLRFSSDHAAHSHLGDVGDMLRRVGFTDVRQEWLGQRHSVGPEEFWNVQAVFDSDARGALTACNESVQDKLKSRYLALCEDHIRRGHQLIYRAGAAVIFAARGGPTFSTPHDTNSKSRTN